MKGLQLANLFLLKFNSEVQIYASTLIGNINESGSLEVYRIRNNYSATQDEKPP